jgi:hypothetical protein
MDTEQLDDEQQYYKEKYLKYKLKYVALKKQLGGRTNRNSTTLGQAMGKGAVSTFLSAKNLIQKATGGFDKDKFLKYLRDNIINSPYKDELEPLIRRTLYSGRNTVSGKSKTIIELIKDSTESSTPVAIENLVNEYFSKETPELKQKLKDYLKYINDNYQK